MLKGGSGQSPTARRSDGQFASEQKRLDFVDQRIGRKVHCVGNRFDADRSSGKHPGNGLQIASVLGVEPQGVDALHVQGIPGHGNGDLAVGPALGIIANPAETIVGQPGRASAASGDFFGRLA